MKIKVALNLGSQVPEIIRNANNIVLRMTGNPDFPSPPVPLATWRASVDDLATKEAATVSRTKGVAKVRNQALALVKTYGSAMAAYVETVANMNPERGLAIVESAGMSVRTRKNPMKNDLEVVDGSVPGSAKLTARSAGRKASYEWQMSTDERTWTALPVTVAAKTTVAGLVTATAYFFRFRSTTRTAMSDWSAPVRFVAG